MDPRERERQIVIEGRKRGLADDFIKEAVLRDRERRQSATPAPAQSQTVTPEAQAQPQKTTLGFLGNIVKSGGRLIKDVGSAAVNTLNPDMEKNTLANILKLAGGAGQLLIPGEQGLEGRARAVGQFYKDRYGGKQNIKDTLYNDPVGAAADVAGLLTGAGAVVGTVGKVGKLAKVSKAGQTISKAGQVVDPLAATGRGVKVVADATAKNRLAKAARLYDSVLGVSKKEAKEVIKSGAKTIGQKTVERGGFGGLAKTKQGIYEASQKGIDDLEAKIQPRLEKISKKFTFEDIAEPLMQERNKLASIPGEEAVVRRFDEILETTKRRFGSADTLDPLEALKNEARKYKSAEEFVKAKGSPVYHGSPTPLKKFSNKKGGVFFTDDYYDATGFAGTPDNVYEGYLNFKKPLVIDAKGRKWDDLNTKWGKTTQEVVGNARKEGYDGVTFKNIIDNAMDDADVGAPGTIHFAHEPETAFVNESQLTDLYNEAKKSSGKGLTASEVNQMKRDLYREIGKAFEKPEADRAVTVRAQTSIARGIRQALEKADDQLKGLNAEQGYHLEVRSKIIDAIAKGEIKDAASAARIIGSLFRPGNLIRDIGTLGVGSLAGGVPGAIIAPIAERALTTTAAVTGRAKAGITASKVIKVAGKAGRKATSNSTINALLRLISQLRED